MATGCQNGDDSRVNTPSLQPALFPESDQFAGYPVLPGAHDAMCEGDGRLRETWRYPMNALWALGPRELRRRQEEARRLLRDNGVTYNVHGDPAGAHRPWQLDLIPLLVDSREWADLERGLIQRAELLDRLLADLYGPRRLLREGLVPADMVYAHEGFLRPCVGYPVPGERYLPVYAVDLVRTPDGGFLVTGDRTQAPSGAGYALENRTVLSRILPSLFRDTHVHRLAGFFRALRATLAGLAPVGRGDDPRTVVLTPGPHNEAYFEHAYLANYLGYTLAQGRDLVSRDGAIHLMTLDGLRRVDVILRRVDDTWCDPLELYEQSVLGVPGLVQAARGGRLGLANPLGSGLAENPALIALLPELCRRLLGEDLQLPGVQTWWCGDPAGRSHVLAHLEHLVIRPINRQAGRACFGGRLSTAERDRLRQRIAAEPYRWVGQDQLPVSTSPVLVDERLEPRHTVLRTFLTAAPEGYVVMPGGLTRVSQGLDDPVVSNQGGGTSKDTWVVASEPERQQTLVAALGRGAQRAPAGGEVPSRVADQLFWLGRYLERAEGVVRLMRVVLLHLTEQFDIPGWVDPAASRHLLLTALTRTTATFPGFTGDGAEARLADPEPELHALLSDPRRLGGLAQTLDALVHNARGVRDQMSSDTWRVVNEIEERSLALRRPDPPGLAEALEELDDLVTALVAFAGLVQENMTHNQAWLFLEMGRRLERGSHTGALLAHILTRTVPEPHQGVVLESVLTILDSLITYRRRYRAGMDVATVLDLVLLDETNPRSLAFQAVRLHQAVDALPRHGDDRRSPEQRLALDVLSHLRLAEGRELDRERKGRRRILGDVLDHTRERLAQLSDTLAAAWFRHEDPPHQLAPFRIGPGP